jgi:predicted XRE-type DNA-binding protein
VSGERPRITRGSGNVFVDLGFSAAEAANLHLRSQLMTELMDRLQSAGLKQATAARHLGVTQPRISDLMRGKIDRFSVDTLIALLGKADKVSFNVPKPENSNRKSNR